MANLKIRLILTDNWLPNCILYSLTSLAELIVHIQQQKWTNILSIW